MKNALSLLAVFTITYLTSSCASALGARRSCEIPELPVRPQELLCISNAQGIGQCYNPVTQKNEVQSMENYVCKNISDHNRHEEWIETITRILGQ